MRVLMMGLNHRTAPVHLREKLAIADDHLPAALAQLAATGEQLECVILSTCNRTEYYIAQSRQAQPAPDTLRRHIAHRAGLAAGQLDTALVIREQDQAVEHLFSVAAGLDAMVLGETQVLGQVRRAYEAAQRAGTVDTVLHQVFQQAIATARTLHATTGIGAGRHSVGSVGVDFIRQVFATLHDKTVLCIGAGEVGKVVLRHTLDLSPARVLLTTRNAARAARLTDHLRLSPDRGGPRPWEALDDLLVDADVVITATAASEPILTADRLRPLIRRRRRRPLFILDTAMPRDVQPEVGSLPNTYLYNLDDLRPIIERNMAGRQGELDRCRAQIRGAASMCMHQIQHQDIGRLIRALRSRLHGLADQETRRTLSKLGDLTPDDARQVQALLHEHTRRLINKVLHSPLSQLDDKNPEVPLGFYAAALRRLFDLDSRDNPADTPADPADTPADNPASTPPATRCLPGRGIT